MYSNLIMHYRNNFISNFNFCSKMRKYIIIFLACFIVGSLAIIKSRTTTCEHLSCLESASTILDNLDTSVNPCDNFYQFACGGFKVKTIIPENQDYVNSDTIVHDLVLEQLYALFENPEKNDSYLSVFDKVRDFYNLCMDTNTIEAEGEQDGREVLKNIGDWPLVDKNWNENNYSWIRHLTKIIKTGISSKFIIDISIALDPKNASRKIIKIDEPMITLSGVKWSVNFDNNHVKNYFKYMVKTLAFFSQDLVPKNIINNVTDIINFERKLASIVSFVDPESKYCYHISIDKLNSKFTFIDWFEFLNSLFSPVMELKRDEEVYLCEPEYFDKLEHLVTKQSPRTLANYLSWRVIDFLIPFLPNKYRNVQFDFSSKYTNFTVIPLKWKECVQMTSKMFNVAVSSMYIRQYFDEEDKNEATKIVDIIHKTFLNSLDDSHWMSDYSKKRAFEKAKQIKNLVGYSDELLINDHICRFYKNLKITPALGFLNNALYLNNFHNQILIKNYRDDTSHDWLAYAPPYFSSVFYSNADNTMQIPAGSLQGFVFRKDRPKYLNFGILGTIIGHEITHGFDTRGKLFNIYGILKNWWDESTLNHFEKKTKCLLDQYTLAQIKKSPLKFSFKEQVSKSEINSIRVHKQNLADMVGLKTAYDAYKQWVQRHLEPILPGISLEYTQKQMFWISAANRLCTVYSKSYKAKMMALELFIPVELRVNIPMKNIKAFAEDWRCSKVAEMNPRERCTVW